MVNSNVNEIIRWYFQYRKLEEQIRVYLIDEFVKIATRELPSCEQMINYVSNHNYEDFATDNSGQISLPLAYFPVLHSLTFYNSNLPKKILNSKYFIDYYYSDKFSCQLSVDYKKTSWANRLVYIVFNYDIVIK